VGQPDDTPDDEWDRIDLAAGSLAASCVVSRDADALRATVRLVGSSSQFCKRSSSLVAPEWEGAIELPDAGVYQVRVDAEAELDLERWSILADLGCAAYVDGDPGDPLFAPGGRVATRYLRGPATVPVALSCPRLTGRRCFEGDSTEGTDRRYVSLAFRVEKVE